jgi:hypothetical protein
MLLFQIMTLFYFETLYKMFLCIFMHTVNDFLILSEWKLTYLNIFNIDHSENFLLQLF